MLTCLVAVFCVACATDPKDLRITEQNKDNFMEELKTKEGLTVEEVGLLVSFQMRRAAAKTFGGSEPEMVGKTVGEVIEEERKLQAEAKAKQAEAERLAAEAKAKEEARRAEMRNALTFAVFDKGFIPSNPMGGRFDDHITLKCAYENKSGKDIRAFRGQLRFTDLFDKEIFTTNLTIQDPIKAGDRANWSGAIEYNQFMDDHQRLRNTELANMKVVWLPDSILFADGTQLNATDEAK